MKIIVMTDVHANLLALRAVLDAVARDGCDAIIHTGDAIGIGPYPAECLDLLLNTPDVRFVMGNHDSYFANGLPEPRPPTMSDGEAQHHRWTHAQLEPGLKAVVARWPYSLDIEEGGTKATFLHYPLGVSGRDFLPAIRQPKPADLDDAFSSLGSPLVFYGHDHTPRDLQGRRRYVNPGPLGCSRDTVARYCSVELSRQAFAVEHLAVTYDRTGLFRAFEERGVPERQIIRRVFFGEGA